MMSAPAAPEVSSRLRNEQLSCHINRICIDLLCLAKSYLATVPTGEQSTVAAGRRASLSTLDRTTCGPSAPAADAAVYATRPQSQADKAEPGKAQKLSYGSYGQELSARGRRGKKAPHRQGKQKRSLSTRKP